MERRYAGSFLGAVEGNVVKHSFVCRCVRARLSLGVVAVLLGACQGPSEAGLKAAEAETTGVPAASPAVKVGDAQLTREQRVAALRKSLSRPLSRSLEGLNVDTLPNGRHAVHLDGRFGHVGDRVAGHGRTRSREIEFLVPFRPCRRRLTTYNVVLLSSSIP